MSKLWNSDEELFGLIRRELFTAVVGDVMDQLGLRRQFLPPAIRALAPGMFAIGRAMTVLEADCIDGEEITGHNPLMQQPFGLMLDALDDLKPGEIYLCTGASPTFALWGELMTTRAKKLRAAGVVLDGYTRDTRGILDLNFPTFCHGSYAQDQNHRGRVVDYRVPLDVGGVRVENGDVVIGDIDGVCIVPKVAEAEVFIGALEKARGEKAVRKAIEAGMSAKQAFETYGIL